MEALSPRAPRSRGQEGEAEPEKDMAGWGRAVRKELKQRASKAKRRCFKKEVVSQMANAG